MRFALPALARAAFLGAALFGAGLSGAQTFAPAQCSTSSADSTCYTTPTTSACSLPNVQASEMSSCPAGYVGRMPRNGTRDACTGSVVWGAGSDTSGCTNCSGDLTATEAQMMQRAVYEVSEQANLAFVDYACPGFSCKDGTQITDPFTGAVMGRTFRDHVWIAVDGFSSGQLPTTNRINYLLSQNRINSNVPPADILPKDPNGYPITNTGRLYLYAKNAAISSGKTTCVGDGMNGCHINCTQPTGGWQAQYCSTQNVQYWACSDSYAVNTPTGRVPTRDVTMPYTTTSPNNYTNKTWDWPTVFGWNNASYGNTGGSVYMCNSTINTCSGWVTDSSTYRCRYAGNYDCSYDVTNPITGVVSTVAQTCSSCDEALGAVWDYRLTQTNDCPRTPRSTRVSDTRAIWQSDLQASGCANTGSLPGSPTCTGGRVATGSTCACPNGSSWNGSSCSTAPEGSAATPAVTFSMTSVSRGASYTGAVMGTLSSGARINAASITSGALPPGLALSFSGSSLTVTGAPTANGSFTYTVRASYPAGVDGAGANYPAGSASGANTIVVTGCDASPVSWSSAAGTCSGAAPVSAVSGPNATIATTSSTPAGLGGTNTLSCNLSSGAWSSQSSSCVAPPQQCLSIYGPEPLGKVVSVCGLPNNAGAHPSGQTLVCTPNGWVTQNPGSSMISEYCE
jgi:hypothetical protein